LSRQILRSSSSGSLLVSEQLSCASSLTSVAALFEAFAFL
jgi:hypothetical protein